MDNLDLAWGKTLDAVGDLHNLKRFPRETTRSFRRRIVFHRTANYGEVGPPLEFHKPWRYWLLWIATLPWDVVVILAVLLIRLFWGRNLEWNEGLWCELKPDSWPTRSWYRYKENGKPVPLSKDQRALHGTWLTWGGTCLGHGGFFGPGKMGKAGIDRPVEFHEHVHVEQAEVSMFTAFIISGGISLLLLTQIPSWASGLGVWTLGYLLMAASGWIVAWFRGEDPYRGSTHEEAAYALTEEYIRKKSGRC